MISKDPSGLRRAGLKGDVHPTHHQVKLGSQRATQRGLDPAASTNRCFRNGRQRAGWQAGQGPGPITPLWKGSSASSVDRPGMAWKWEGASAWSRPRLRKGRPQPHPFFPVPPAEKHRALGGNKGRRHVAGMEPGHGHCTALDPGPRAVSGRRPCHRRGRGLITGNSAPQRGSTVGRHREARPHIRGHPTQDPSQEGSPACSLRPIGSLRAGTGAQWT